MSPFSLQYSRLNPQQKEAVDAIEGPVMVVAGPGTGKTQILTLRIANILQKTDVPADAILALTFTNAAAANMRKRLTAIIGSDAYRVSIHTFHSFAQHLIETHEERFGELVGRSNCSDVERLDIVRTLLDQGRYEILKPLSEPYHHVSAILSAINHLKQEGMIPADFRAWVEQEKETLLANPDLYHEKGVHKGKMKTIYQKQEKHNAKNAELALLYERYQEELAKRKRFDFDDSLIALIHAMETSEDFLRELQEEYQYFLVDEHQDTNGAQNKILELLATFFDTPNLFVVGDEKQAVFRFQGASLANFLYFEKKFRDVRRITLTQNYRSHQGVLDSADSLIAHNKEGIPAPLSAFTKAEEGQDLRVRVHRFGADDEELLFLADEVKARIAGGTPAHEIAVLYRNNSDAEGIADYFERLGIPFVIASGHGVLDDPDIQKLNLILRALTDLENTDALAKVLFISFLGLSLPDVYALLRETRKRKCSLFEVLCSEGIGGRGQGVEEQRNLTPTLSLQGEGVTLLEPDAVARFTQNIIAWKQSAENESFLRLFERVVRDSGFLKHIASSTFHTEKFDKVVRLFDEAKALSRRTPFFSVREYDSFLCILEEHNITLTAQSRHTPNAVFLMTAHKAKGLEFDFVYIVHAYNGHWGGRKKREQFSLPYRSGGELVVGSDEEDERRLFYVAITRARKDVAISYAVQGPDGRERVPTQFIEEIRSELRAEKDSLELGYANKRPPLFVEHIGRSGAERYGEFVRSAFAERGLSATALNNYLACPWKWFFRSFFYTQFTETPSQVKGTAVHGALQDFFNAWNKDSSVSADFLVERFVYHIQDADIPLDILERITRDTRTALLGWYESQHLLWKGRSVQELFVKVLLEQAVGSRQSAVNGQILLTGKLDKIVCLDEQCKEVQVVDYKTGKPKSRNEIEGMTESAQRIAGSGAYKRQLVFYKLLLDRYQEGKYKMQEGVIDFIEPMPSGAYRRESFPITKEETEAFEEEIRRVAEEITSLSFWGAKCADPDCEECALREMLG